MGIWLVHITLGGSVLMLLARAGMNRLRQPAQRQRLGELAVLAALTLALAGLLPAWLLIPWPGVTEPPSPAEAPAPLMPWETAAAEPWEPDILPLPQTPEPPAPLGEAATIIDIGDVGKTVLAIAVLIYGVGAALSLLRWLVGHFVLYRILREATPAPARIVELFAASTGQPHSPRLLISRRLRVPVSCGLLRPTIILPADFCASLDLARLPLVFAHEYTHLARRDAWSGLLFALAQVLFFHLPWFWSLRRQVRLCQEYVADAAALQAGSPDEYAEFLLTWATAPAVPMAATGVSGNTSDLYRRVNMLLNNPLRIEARCPRLWTFSIASVLLALAVVLGGVGLTAQAQDTIIIIRTQPKDAVKVVPPSAPAAVREAVPLRVLLPKEEKQTKDVIILRSGTDPKGDKEAENKVIRVYAGLKDALKGVEPGDGKGLAALAGLPGGSGAGGADLAELKKVIDQIKGQPTEQQVEQIRKAIENLKKQATKTQGQALNYYRLAASTGPGLGIKLSKPSEILAEQLNLPKGQGLVVTEVKVDSAAAKAGLKVNDIILKANQKNVSDDVKAFTAQIDALKGDATLDLVVLRKGKEATIQGLKPAQFTARLEAKPLSQTPLTRLEAPHAIYGATGQSVMTTSLRTGDRFNTRYQEGSLIITVTGKVTGGKAAADHIHIQDGQVTNRYSTVAEVPAQYTDKVNHLIKISSGTEIQTERKKSGNEE